jgi:hypothetical protein
MPPCERGGSPCCSAVQCSFVLASDVKFSRDIGPVLFVLRDTDGFLRESQRAGRLGQNSRGHGAFDDPLFRCALLCRWQI